MADAGVVLVVEPDENAAGRLGEWLADDGHSVLTCTGPTAPGYECPGSRGEGCPLVENCDVVVLDLRLDTDTMMEGTPGWQLLLHYQSLGKPVIALAGPEDHIEILSENHVIVLPRRPDRRALVGGIRTLMGLVYPSKSPDRTPPFPSTGPRTSGIDLRDAGDVADFADIWL